MSPNHFTFLIESALNKLEEKMIERWKKEGEDYRKVRKKWRNDGQGSFAQTGVLNVFSRVNCGMRKKWGKSAKFWGNFLMQISCAKKFFESLKNEGS